MLMAFTGLRWEEAVAVAVENVDLDGQWITVDRTASESGGKRDIRTDLKTRAAERVVAIPDIAMPAVRRLVDSRAKGREISTGKLYTRLVNGERGGYLGLLIASAATDMQVANQMGHSKIETTKNIYGHLFAQDRASILKAMNQAVSRLYVQEDDADGGNDSQAA
jgi:integrase